MAIGPSANGSPGRMPARSGPGPGVYVVAALFLLVVVLGVLGRLVPDSRIATERASPPSPVPSPVVEPGVRVISPLPGVVWLRTTEIAVRGAVPLDVRTIEAAIRIDAHVLGRTTIQVDQAGRFDGAVQVIPPRERSSASLELSAPGPYWLNFTGGRRLAEVAFLVEAGADLLILHPTEIVGEAGETTLVDVLVYADLREVRGLLTSPGGSLIAETSTRLGGPATEAGAAPRTIALELELPDGRLPDRARLHVLGIDESGSEVEHIDANVRLSSGD